MIRTTLALSAVLALTACTSSPYLAGSYGPVGTQQPALAGVLEPAMPRGPTAHELQVQQQARDMLMMSQQRTWDWYKAQQGWGD